MTRTLSDSHTILRSYQHFLLSGTSCDLRARTLSCFPLRSLRLAPSCFKTRNKGRIKRGQALAGSHKDKMVQDEEHRLAAPSNHPLPCQPSLVLTSASSQKCCSPCLSTELRDRQSLPLRSEQQQAPGANQSV